MPTIVDGVTFYSEEEGRERAYAKTREDAEKIAKRYRKSDIISA